MESCHGIKVKNKNKLGFINNSCVRQTSDEVFAKQWDGCNSVVFFLGFPVPFMMSYMLDKFFFSKIDSAVWQELKETDYKGGGSVIFNLDHKINSLRQNEMSVFEYHDKLNSLWREFDTLLQLPACIYM